MSLSRDTPLTISSGVQFEVRDGRLVVDTKGGQRDYGIDTLELLAAFRRPCTMAKALATTAEGSVQGFVEASARVLELVDQGVLVADGGVSFAANDSTFDGAAVHIAMLDDHARTSAYVEALRANVRPDDVVLDIGTGTGILAATAAQAGARHVYAVEKGAVAAVAERVLESNGLADRSTVIQALSTEVELPEPVTLLVSEILGNDPFAEGLLGTYQDANRRLLAEGARRIPERLHVGLRLVAIDETLKNEIFVSDAALERWRADYGVDMAALAEAKPDQPFVSFLKSAEIVKAVVPLSETVTLVDLDLGEVRSHLDARVELEATMPGPVSALMMTFTVALDAERELTSDVTRNPTSHWRTPLWVLPEPRTMAAGDRLAVHWRHSPTGTRLSLED